MTVKKRHILKHKKRRIYIRIYIFMWYLFEAVQFLVSFSSGGITFLVCICVVLDLICVMLSSGVFVKLWIDRSCQSGSVYSCFGLHSANVEPVFFLYFLPLVAPWKHLRGCWYNCCFSEMQVLTVHWNLLCLAVNLSQKCHFSTIF